MRNDVWKRLGARVMTLPNLKILFTLKAFQAPIIGQSLDLVILSRHTNFELFLAKIFHNSALRPSRQNVDICIRSPI